MKIPAFSKRIRNYYWFTLVELVIVITILAILGTIGFLSIQGYSSSARDSTRVSNLSSLQKGLTLWKVVSWTFPMPENEIALTASGTPIGYQGFAKDQVAGIAKLSPRSTRDPLDMNIYTTYAVNANQTKMQLMAFLEDGSRVTGFNILPGVGEALAAGASSYASRSPMTKGDALGILLGNAGGNLNQPAQELASSSFTGIDLAKTTTGSGYAIVFTKDESTAAIDTSGTGAYTGSLFTYTYNKRADLLAIKALASNDPSLIGYFDMETMTGWFLKDLSGYGSDGTIIGSDPAIEWKVGGSRKFAEAQTSTIVNTNTFVGAVMPKVTLSSWFKSDTSDISGVTVSIGDVINGGGGAPVIWINNGAPTCRIMQNSSTATFGDIVSPNTTYADNQWHQIALTYDDITKVAQCYVDGVNIGSLVTTGTMTEVINNYKIWIGQGGAFGYFTGLIDEVRIYNRVLSDSEIWAIFTSAK